MFKNKPSAYVEDIPLLEQYIIYSAAVWVLNDYQHMRQYCKANSIGKSELTHSMKYIPFWYLKVINQSEHSSYVISIDEIKNAISYLQNHDKKVSLGTISTLVGIRLDRRKRPDIFNILRDIN